MTMPVNKLKAEILAGIVAGETVIIPRQTFWMVDWPRKKALAEEMGDFLAELRAKYCIQHAVSFEGYEFTKAG